MKLFVSLLVLTTLSFYAPASTARAPRIIGGNEAKTGQFPFVASVLVQTSGNDQYGLLCGGALLSEEWVLTSGVCTSSIVSAYIGLGAVTRDGDDDNRVNIAASDIIPHPEFNPDTLANDIGLLKLEQPVELSDSIQPIKLTTLNLPNILRPTAMGWGQTSDDDSEAPDQLFYVQLNLLTNDECKQTFGDQIIDTMVCAKGSTDESICYGDAGGPLVVRPLGSSVLQHVGVASFFSAEGCAQHPSGFTRTYPYVSWIKNVTGIA